MTLLRLAPLLLVACSGGSDDSDTSSDTDSAADTDTAADPVWEVHRVATSSTLNGVFTSGGGVYVVGTAAGAYLGGAEDNWTALPTGLPDEEDFTDLWGQGAGESLELLAAGTSGNVARFSSGAWATEDLGTADHQGVGGSSIEGLYVVSFGGIFVFDGASWTFEAPPGDERLNDVWGIGSDLFAVGEGGAILRHADGAWTAQTSGVLTDLNAVAGVAINDVWAVGADGVALHFDGTTWTATTTGVDEALWAVFAPSPDVVFAVGNAGVALVWNGIEWAPLPTGVDNNLYAIHGVSETNVWAVGNRGMVLQYTGG